MELLGIMLDYPITVPEWLIPTSPLTAMIIGSILSGVGYGLIVAVDTSTGGSDLLGMIIAKKCPRISIGMVMTGLDIFVVILAGFLDGLASFTFSLAAMALCNGTIDIVSYLVGNGAMPVWINKVKTAMVATRKRMASAKISLNPYAALASVLFFIIMFDVLSDAVVKLVIPV